MMYIHNNVAIDEALEHLKKGGVIIYPTDTAWALGCDATNEEAVDKIIKLKKRDATRGMPIITDKPGNIPRYVKEMPALAWDIIELSVKPITIFYPQGINLAKGVLTPDGSVAIRVTSELFSKSLCARLKAPIVATSANFSGENTPRSFREINPALKIMVSHVTNARQDESPLHVAHGVIMLGTGGEVQVIRK